MITRDHSPQRDPARRRRLKRLVLLLLAGLLCATLVSSTQQIFLRPVFFKPEAGAASLPSDASPYGVCAHITRSEERVTADTALSLMQAGGVGWVRSDFDWAGVEPRQGEWTFDHLDRIVELAESANIQVLPILAYDVAWARPAYQNLDAWLEYVYRVVSRYKDRLRYWEVWNEPNAAPFWYGRPSAPEYAKLLEATYLEIKDIDPELTVLMGGLSGVPLSFIDSLYNAGAGPYFDILNVHPYRGDNRPEPGNLYEDLKRVRSLIDRHGDTDKPIWITEMGWSSRAHLDLMGDFLQGMLQSALSIIDPQRQNWQPVALSDPDYPDRIRDEAAEKVRRMLAPMTVRTITLEDLQMLSAQDAGLLVMPPSEAFPADYFDFIESYVQDGGVVLFWSGVPLYYARRQNADGTWNSSIASGSYRRRLRIAFEASWTRNHVPRRTTTSVPAAAWRKAIPFPAAAPESANRFLTNSALERDDQFESIVDGTTAEYIGSVAGVYTLRGDSNGAVIVTTLRGLHRGLTAERQAQMLPRAYLLAFEAGIDKVFWYEFQSTERHPFNGEHHFGLTHRDLEPKPAYQALATLERARPGGSISLTEDASPSTDGINVIHWRRPDSRDGWALWRTDGTGTYTLSIHGRIVQSFDYLGKRRRLSLFRRKAIVDIGESILYLVGPEKVEAVEYVNDGV